MGAIDWKIGARIAFLRKKRGLTITEFARAAGISRKWAGMLERGVKTATNDILMKIAAAHNARCEWLIAGEPAGPMEPGMDNTVESCVVPVEPYVVESGPMPIVGLDETGGPEWMVVSIDFGDCPEVMRELREIASAEDRTPMLQARYFVRQGIKTYRNSALNG